jgi:hypothetical protein
MIHFEDSNTIEGAWHLDYPSIRIQIQILSNMFTEIANKKEILYRYKHHRGGLKHFLCFQYLDATTSSHGIGAQQSGDESNKELSWQDDSLWRLTLHVAWYFFDYPSARIQIQLSSNRFTEIGNKMEILYQGISITE